MTLDADADRFGLFVMGRCPSDTNGHIVLLGAGQTLWPQFRTSAEYIDGQPDPLDRWSKRVIGTLGAQHKARAVFPSDGPPYAPFIAWALATGQFFQSPTGMMVHVTAGLMISIRGALMFDDALQERRQAAKNPCETCDGQPCASACPVGALAAHHAYDVPACKSYLGTDAGKDCMTQGCVVRRACPISQRFDRDPSQSAFHMNAFKKG